MASKRQRRKRRRRAEGGAPQRATETTPAPEPPASASARRTEGPPPAPWGSFPLSELVVLIALILLIGGFIVPPPRGAVMLGAGLVLGSLAGLELSAREHFSGYRSHTLLLAGAVGMAVIAGLYFLGPDSLTVGVALIAGLIVFALSVWVFATAFRRRSGGELFRFRGG